MSWKEYFLLSFIQNLIKMDTLIWSFSVAKAVLSEFAKWHFSVAKFAIQFVSRLFQGIMQKSGQNPPGTLQYCPSQIGWRMQTEEVCGEWLQVSRGQLGQTNTAEVEGALQGGSKSSNLQRHQHLLTGALAKFRSFEGKHTWWVQTHMEPSVTEQQGQRVLGLITVW